MKKYILYLLTGILLTTIVSCKYTEKIKDGSTAFERKQYAVAAKMLVKEFEKTKSRIEQGKLAYLIGESFSLMNQNEKSIKWYKIAYDNQFGVDALKKHAFALKQNQQYTDAKKAFKDLGFEIGSPYEYRREISACEMAEAWMKDTDNSGFTINPAKFNSSYADYAPNGFGDQQLVFTSDRGTVDEKKGPYKWTGNAFSDIYVLDLASGNVDKFDAAINSGNNEGTACFNNSFTEIFFTRCFGNNNEDYYCKLMTARKENGTWTTAEQLNFTEEKVNYGHPTLSTDGKTLYFASNHSDGWGGYDIYYSERDGDIWSAPKLMSRSINTVYDEKFPYIDKDTLYFASTGHTGMGGLDIFKSYKMDQGRWAPVHNLKSPVNSGADDFGIYIDYRPNPDESILQTGYFSSSRNDGKGNDDIYVFEKRNVELPPPPPEDTTVAPVEIVYKMILEGYVLEKIYERKDDPGSKVLGRKPLSGAKVQVNSGGGKQNFVVEEDGKFTIELNEDTNYNFFGTKENYLNNSESFSTKGIGHDPGNPILKFEIEIVLDKIFKNKEIVMDDIYYDFDKWDIREDAKPQLDKLIKIMNENPDINITLASHTDCRGNNSYNQKLSQRRAQSAVNYLISKGINAAKLSAVGYGESALRVDCVCTKCSEEEHQLNRRTTFAIVD